MTRLLFVNQYFPPDEAATAQILGDLVEAAVRAGRECRVVTSDRGYADPERRFPGRETWNGAAVERVSSTGFGRGATAGRVLDYATFLAAAGRRLLGGPRPDVVIGLSTPPLLGAMAVAAARARGARSVYWAMDVHPDVAFALGVLRPGSPAGRFLERVSRWTLRNADLVVALGDAMAARLRAKDARRVAVVHNWTDDETIRPRAARESAYRKARGWGERFVVVYSGNMGLAHDFATVLDAAARLQGVPVTFAFIGRGPRHDETAREAAARGLKNVEFHPAVRRELLADVLSAADVHAVTLRESVPGLLVPSKIYGILAAGRPTLYVGPAEGEVFEIVRDAGCGVAVAPGDGESLAAAIEAYRNDPSRRAREGTAARSFLEARFSRRRMTGDLLRAIDQIADGTP